MVEENYKQMEKKRILQPTNDVVFQVLFGKGKENITKAMLEDILKIKIQQIDLDKGKELLNDKGKNKNGRVDIRAILNGNIECDIEVQLVKHEKMIERFLYYWAKMYSASLQVGQKYKALRKTISIIIVGEDIPQFKQIAKAHTKWQLREESYQKVVLTEYCEFHIIEILKATKEYENNKNDEVLQWMKFLNNPEDMEVARIMEENEDIQKAKEELDELSKNDALWREALDAEIVRMDNEQRMYEAKRDGKIEGRREGIKEGIKEAKLETAKKMLEEKIPIEIIVRVTGLTEKEIKS